MLSKPYRINHKLACNPCEYNDLLFVDACSGAECEDVGNCVTINGDCSCQDNLVFDEDRACVGEYWATYFSFPFVF